MATHTDAAKELADLCIRLRGLNSTAQGSQVLATHFDVPVWSADFYELIFTVTKRVEQLKLLVNGLENIDIDIREQAKSHLDAIHQAFSQNGLNNQWSHASSNFISAEHVNPIRMLSSEVRRVQPLPQLSEGEMQELTGDVDELLGWLRERQINEQDFIRQAIIEGLESFRFRIKHVSWVGWGYTLDSLRSVIGAYLALERGINPVEQPDGQAVILKVSAVLKTVFEKVGVVKDTAEKAQWLIEGYKNISAAVIAHQGIVSIAGAIAGG